jgi:ADP-ribosylglycohydrolase
MAGEILKKGGNIKMKKIYALLVAFVLAFASVASADGTPFDTLAAAANLTGLSTTVVAILVSMLGIMVIFTGYRLIRRAIR